MIQRRLTGSWYLALLAAPLLIGCGSSSEEPGQQPDSGTGTPDAGTGTPDAGTDAGGNDTNPDAQTACTISPAFEGGDVTADLVLTRACSPYTIDTNIRVQGNATLTIEPGVTLRFTQGVELIVGYSSAGKLVAEGTAAAPIVFTSAAATPSAGSWGGIKLYGNTMAGNKLTYVTLDYCGEPNDGCVVGVNGLTAGAVTIDHVTIDHVGTGADGIAQDGADQKFAITNTTFPAGAIHAGDYALALDASSFAGIGAGNTFNGAPIELRGGYVETNATWLNPGTPIVVTSNVRVEGTASPILTLAPGTQLKFANGMGLWVGYSDPGQLVAEGTATAPIVFTSNAATPGAGDWAGISLWDGTANGTKLAYATLDYCGEANSACIDATGGVEPDRVVIDHVTINHVGAGADGISENGAESRFRISNCTFPAGAIPTGRYAISLDAASFAAIGTGNTFNNALIQVTGGYIETTTTWNNPGTALAVTSQIRVEGTATPVLTLNAGMTLKFGADRGIWVGYSYPGRLVVAGTSASHVTLTSLASTPGRGDWEGIIVWDGGEATVGYADISYAGGNASYPGGVAAATNEAAMTVTNSTVSQSAGYGLFVDCDTNATVTGCTFTGNALADQGPVCP